MKDLHAVLLVMFASLLFVAGCGAFTDPATRVAFAIKAGASRLGSAEGSTCSIHTSPAHHGECVGPYTVQLDKVGALIVWCRNATGVVIASGSTSYHSRFVVTPKTYILDKPPGSILTFELERRNGDAVIAAVN